jgi:hypothetical protein
MRKGFLAICLSLVVAIVLLAAFVPSCAPTTGKIVVQATLCGNPWPTQGTGAVNYTLTPGTGSPISGTSVPATHSGVAPGSWTCAYVSGGPAGTFLKSITPLATQTVSAGNTTTFTLNFELNQDAAIHFLTWTVNGQSWPDTTWEGGLCNIIDVHFLQWVNGCTGYNVTLNETSLLQIIQTAAPAQAPPVMIYVVNNDCAVNKTATPQGLTPVKKSQVPSINNATAQVGNNIPLAIGVPTMLDVHTQWQLVKGTNYTKAINWFGISKAPFEPAQPPHPCVLFELVLPAPGIYQFTLQASADVELVGATDVDPGNNHDMSAPITLVVTAGPL